MKKNYLKKVLAISLSVALVFGTMAMPVFAEEPQDQEGPLKIPQEPEMKTMEEAQVRTLLEGENLSVQAQSGKEEIVEISTAADLEKLRTQPTGHYLLKGSIDLGNIDWEPIPFKGTFDGGGNTISNFRVSGKYGGLFSTIVGGKIMNLTVKDAVIDNSRASRGVASGIGSLSSSTAVNCTVENVTVSGSQCTSAIFGIAENSTVDGCHVKNSTVNGVYSEKLGFSNPWGIGGLVGESFGKTEIKNSTVENTAVVCATNKISNDNHADAIGGLVGDSYNVNISNCKVMGGSVSGYNNVGGVVGYSKFGTIEDSMSSADVTGDNNLGGFAGYFGSDQSSKLDRAEITRCWATGTVQGACEIGGFIGTTAWVKIDSSFATGDVKANNYWANTGISCAGGFVGRTNLSSLITNSYATGSVEGRKGVGGFVGYNRTGNGVDPAAIMTTDSAGLECRNSKVSECYATGDVTATDLYGNSSAGGFVGENGGTATFPVNCYATGNVTGYKNVGGFGGTFDSSGAVNCYATGTVTANTEGTAGGFSGLAVRYSRGAVQFINCVFDKNGAGTDQAIGTIHKTVKEISTDVNAKPAQNPPVNNIRGMASADMQKESVFTGTNDVYTSSYTGKSQQIPWNFETLWQSGAGTAPYLRGIDGDQSVGLTVAPTGKIQIGDTVVVTLTKALTGNVTWAVSQEGTLVKTEGESVTVKASSDGLMKVTVLSDGIKKKSVNILVGNGGEKGIGAIFITPAPMPGGQEAYNIDVNAVLKVVFTKSIDVNGFKNLVDNVQVTTNGNPIGIEYKFAENDTVLIVTPKQKLTDGTKYQFVLSSKIAAKDSQLQLKGNHSMEFTTNSFDKPTVMLKKNGVKAENIASTGGTYSIEAVYKNNIPQIGDYTETTTARVFVVVRGGKGARATYGGDVLLSKEQPLTIATDQTKTIISEAFTIPEGMKGNLYVDVYTWDDAESYAKALPVHNTYKIEK